MQLKNLLPIFWFVILVCLPVAYAPECGKTGEFVQHGKYDINRGLLLSSLASNVSARGGFYNASMGKGSDRVYALGMCMQGVDPNFCSKCINFSSNLILDGCNNQTEGYSWNEKRILCMVRYSNYNIFGQLVTEPLSFDPNPKKITSNLTEFDQKWTEFTGLVVAGATSPSSSKRKYYAAAVGLLTADDSIYALMQCTPDISLEDCSSCLKQSVSDFRSCCDGNQGGVVYRASCLFRWDLFPFLEAFSDQAPVIDLSTPAVTVANATSTKKISTGTIVAIVVVPILLLALGFAFCKRRKSFKAFTTEYGYFSVARRLRETTNATDEITTSGSLQFEFQEIKAATSNFHNINKLGHDGFGQVYKGTLPNGTEIAVKRLSKNSGQGEEEFKNEVFLVAKLQHRNLVWLLGFSVKGAEEKILVYEFLPNKSLDHFLFDPIKKVQLDWTRRYNIIEGITRGILYLHQDSRLKIIHRDLKAGNILLDADMNPKIADFGMARYFRVDQTEASTRRVVGTFGYMPPEYIVNGQFSTKSDVYSFGVLILEIIGGKKNSSFHDIDGNLVTYVWRLWNKESLLELVDASMGENYDRNEVIRCIHIGLLCVQENPDDRPTMSTIIHMLTSTSITLPVPQPPGFFLKPNSSANKLQPGSYTSMSFVSITCLSPR